MSSYPKRRRDAKRNKKQAKNKRAAAENLYFIDERGRISKKTVRSFLALCNFSAKVEEELTLDDGAERTHFFQISGRREGSPGKYGKDGQPFSTVRVPSSRFGSMNWVLD